MSNPEKFQPTVQNTAAAIQRLADLETRLAAPVYEETITGELAGLRQSADLYVGKEPPKKPITISPNAYTEERTEARFGLERQKEGMVVVATPVHPSLVRETSLVRSKKAEDGTDKKSIRVSVLGKRVTAVAMEDDRIVDTIDGKDPNNLGTIRREAAKSVRRARQVRHRKQDWIKSSTERLKQEKLDAFRDFADM